jgi:hypothetical protein
MTITVDQFRIDYQEFSDLTRIPDAEVQFNLNLAYLLLPDDRWSGLLDAGAELFTAHMLVLKLQNLRTVSIGGIPGQQTGIVTSKAVGGVSVSYDTASALMADWAFWNLSNYGTRFAFLANMVGMGADTAGIGFQGAAIPVGVIGGGNLLGQD